MPDQNLSLPPRNAEMERAIQQAPVVSRTPQPSAGKIMFGFMISVFILFLIASWIYSIIDVLKSEFKDGSAKIAWLIAIIFLPFTALFYIFIAQNQKKTKK